MSERFDELARQVARPTSRRGVLKAMGIAVAGATAATLIKPFRADAACPAGETQCGNTCCKGACSNPATSCCCGPGTTPCGPTCCKRGIACVDSGAGICGCPARTTPCGSGANLTCCDAGTACGPSNTTCVPASSSGTTAGCGCSTCGSQSCANSSVPCGLTTFGGSATCHDPCFVTQTTEGCSCVDTRTVPFCQFDCDPNTPCASGMTCIACCGSGYTCVPPCTT